MTSEGRRLAVGTLVLAALAVFVALRMEVTTDIGHFLPGGDVGSEVTLAKELAAGELSRTLVLLVDAPDREAAVRASRDFEEALRAEPRVSAELAFLDAGPPAGIEEAMWTLYEPRRFAFLDAEPEEVASRLTPEALGVAVRSLKERLASPMSSLVSRVAPGDPLLVLPRLFERLVGSRAESLAVEDGRFLTDDGAAVLFAGTRAPSFDSARQRPFLEGVRSAFAAVDRAHDDRLELQMSGAAKFAVRAEEAIRADIRRVTIGSLAGLTLLLVVLFRSLRLVLLTLPVLASGFLVGTASCLLVFGRVHGLTLAFGAALIGVSIDYTVHFHCHWTLAPHPAGPRRTLAGLWTGLSLGAATTIVGFVALLVATFPGLRELATFAAFGIAAALFATTTFLPALTAQDAAPRGLAVRAASALGAGLARLARRRALLLAPVGLASALALLGLPQLRWNDDVADLNRLDPDLLEEDEAVRERVVRYEQRRLVVAMGRDEEEALQVNDRVNRALDESVAAGELGGFRSVAALLPSAARQRAVDAAFRGAPDVWTNVECALAEEGFVTGAFAPFRQALSDPAPEPLVPADLQATPLEPLVRPFRVTLDEGVGVLSFLHDIGDEAALAERVAAVDGARLIDIQAVFGDAYSAYRQRMTSLLLLGLVGVVALVWLRHRAVRPTVAACAPAMLAAAGTVGALALVGAELNFLSLVALLMIVSMGVDYGVFLAEAGDDDAALSATYLAVTVAAVSTLLGFGLLSFSDHPALFSIGSTSGLGVALCLLLAPTVRLAARGPSSTEGPS